jgi:hypothetical protein
MESSDLEYMSANRDDVRITKHYFQQLLSQMHDERILHSEPDLEIDGRPTGRLTARFWIENKGLVRTGYELQGNVSWHPTENRGEIFYQRGIGNGVDYMLLASRVYSIIHEWSERLKFDVTLDAKLREVSAPIALILKGEFIDQTFCQTAELVSTTHHAMNLWDVHC